jgi:outer membrane protein OmpA-like peptidoglycan-associated protein
LRRSIYAAILIVITTLSACQTTTGLTPAQTTLLQREGFKLTEEGWELNLSAKLLFASDSENLSAEVETNIVQLTQELLKVGIDHARLEGHTDNTGASAYNDQLSLRRADSVAQIMIRAGMSAEKIATQGRGQREPLYDNNTAQGRSENRRVAIIIDSGS